MVSDLFIFLADQRIRYAFLQGDGSQGTLGFGRLQDELCAGRGFIIHPDECVIDTEEVNRIRHAGGFFFSLGSDMDITPLQSKNFTDPQTGPKKSGDEWFNPAEARLEELCLYPMLLFVGEYATFVDVPGRKVDVGAWVLRDKSVGFGFLEQPA